MGAACFFMRKHGPLFRPRAANRARSLPALSRKKRRLLRLGLELGRTVACSRCCTVELVSRVHMLSYHSPVLCKEAAVVAREPVEDGKEGDR